MYSSIPTNEVASTSTSPSSSFISFRKFCEFVFVFVFILWLTIFCFPFLLSLKAHASSAPIHSIFLLHVQPSVFYQSPTCFYNVYTYSGSIPGPTITVNPGETFTIRVINSLGNDQPINDLTVPQGSNVYHSINTTSIHFHGMHLSPVLVDNVFLPILPGGTTLDLVVPVSSKHASGTFYIHPHFHGSTALQAAFAMAAPLIVLDTDVRWRAVPSETLTIQVAGLDTRHADSDARLAFQLNHGLEQPTTALCNKKQPMLLVNGRFDAHFVPCNDVARRWRVIQASTDGALILRWNSTSPSCRVYIIARDGIYLDRMEPFRNGETAIVPTGGRIDFVQRGACTGARLSSSPVDAPVWLGSKTKLLPEMDVLVCQTTQETTTSLPIPRTLPNHRPDKDFRHLVPSQRKVLAWTEFEDGAALSSRYGVNAVPYSGSKPQFVVKLGELAEWVIVNPYLESHPFHLHTNHFQLVDTGEWRDTVLVPAPGNVTIRFIARDFTGPTLFHCHILQHEDLGMTWRFDIV